MVERSDKRNLSPEEIRALHPADLADLFERAAPDQHRIILGLLDREGRAELLIHLDGQERRDFIERSSTADLAGLIVALDSDDAADLLGDLKEHTAVRVLERLDRTDPDDAQEVRALLDYPEDSAGGLMQSEIASITYGATADEALQALRASQDDADSMHFIFVTDRQKRFIGVVPMVRLALAAPDSGIASIFEPKFIDVQASVDQEEVAQIFAKYDIISLAVVDEEERLLGRIMVDDVIEVLGEEADEDAFLMVGSDPEELVYQDSALRVAMIRLPWLLLNLAGSIGTGGLLWAFQATLMDTIALISFVPVITAMAGNVGAQSSMIMIRNFASGRAVMRSGWRHFGRESLTGLIIGVPCGLILGVAATLWHGEPAIGLIVALSLFLVMSVSAAIGGVAPSLFRAIGVDPAIAAGPMVTTANDLIGILIYMLIAGAVLSATS